MNGLTWRTIVANNEVRIVDGLAAAGDSETWAARSVAGNALGALPDDLGEMTPAAETAAGVGLAVQVLKERSFIVVHGVGEHGTEVAVSTLIADILAVSTTVVRAMDHC